MSITTLTIDGVNIATTYNFYLAKRQLNAPPVKSEYIEIPDSNGSFDATEAFGSVFYGDRDLTLDLVYSNKAFDSDLSSLTNYLHGKKRKIVFGSDSSWYHIGRITVGNYDSVSHKLSVTAKVFPYKLATTQTVVTKAVTTSDSVTLTNDEMPVTPVITNDAEMTLTWGTSNSKTISAGTHIIAGLELSKGDTTIGIAGTGNITFTYRKGRL